MQISQTAPPRENDFTDTVGLRSLAILPKIMKFCQEPHRWSAKCRLAMIIALNLEGPYNERTRVYFIFLCISNNVLKNYWIFPVIINCFSCLQCYASKVNVIAFEVYYKKQNWQNCKKMNPYLVTTLWNFFLNTDPQQGGQIRISLSCSGSMCVRKTLRARRVTTVVTTHDLRQIAVDGSAEASPFSVNEV